MEKEMAKMVADSGRPNDFQRLGEVSISHNDRPIRG